MSDAACKFATMAIYGVVGGVLVATAKAAGFPYPNTLNDIDWAIFGALDYRWFVAMLRT